MQTAKKFKNIFYMKRVFGLMVAVLFVAATSFAQTPATTTTTQKPVRQEVKKVDDATRQANIAKRDSIAAARKAAVAKGSAVKTEAKSEAKKTAVAKGNAVKAEAKPELKKVDDATKKAQAEKRAARKAAASEKKAAVAATTTPSTGQHLTKDGAPDKRYKENKSGAAAPKPDEHLKKDGTPDKRFKENKKDSIK